MQKQLFPLPMLFAAGEKTKNLEGRYKRMGTESLHVRFSLRLKVNERLINWYLQKTSVV